MSHVLDEVPPRSMVLAFLLGANVGVSFALQPTVVTLLATVMLTWLLRGDLSDRSRR